MRIGMVLSTPIPAQEGIGFYVWNLSRQLRRLGHQVVIITRGTPGKKTHEEIDGIPVIRPPFFPVYPFHVNIHGNIVNRLIRELGDDIDLFHFHTPLIKAPKTDKPVIVTAHTPMQSDMRSTATNGLSRLLTKFQASINLKTEQALFERADALTALAKNIADGVREYDISHRKVTVVGKGVDTSIFHPLEVSQNKRFENKAPYALTVAPLETSEGLSDLIECAKIVAEKQPKFRFIIAGNGPLKKELRNQIKQNQLEENVILEGYIKDRDRLVELYQNASIFLHPAHNGRLSTTLLEAMGCGCPVIITEASGALDVVHQRHNGLIITPQTPSKMAESVFELLDNRAQAKSLGQAASDTIRDYYTWTIVTQGYIKQYEKFIEVQKMLFSIGTVERIEVPA